jgi:hypothetical protein
MAKATTTTVDDGGSGEGPTGEERSLDHYLGFARGHGETADTRQWIADLEDMLRVAWGLMTPEQRAAFREHPDVLSIAEAAGEEPDPAS